MWVYVNINLTIHKQHVLSMWTHMNSLKSRLEWGKNNWAMASAQGSTHAVSPAQLLCADAAQ